MKKLIELSLVRDILIESLGEDVASSIIKRLETEKSVEKDVESIPSVHTNGNIDTGEQELDEEMFKEFEEKDVPVFDNSKEIEHHAKMLEEEALIEEAGDLPKEKEVQKTDKKPSVKRELTEPKVKKEYFIVLATSYKEVPDNLTGWVVQADEGTRPEKIIDGIKSAKDIYNSSKKGTKMPAGSIGEAMEIVSAKTFKEEGLAIKTKMPVWCVTVE